MLRLELVAREPELDICLHRRGHVRRPAEKRRPRAVLALLGADPARGRLGRARLEYAEVVTQEEIFCVDRHVGLELALPVAVLVLEREQVVAAAREREPRRVDARRERDGHRANASSGAGALTARSSSAARAATSPLRTAPSMVAGQPVSVQAPAR